MHRFTKLLPLALLGAGLALAPAMPASAGEGLTVDLYNGRHASKIVSDVSLGEGLTAARERCGMTNSPASSGTLVRDIMGAWKDADTADKILVCVAAADGSPLYIAPAGSFPTFPEATTS